MSGRAMSGRVANCVFCDDLREEIGNKISLMGLYFQEIVIGAAAPASITKLVIAIWLICDVDDLPERVVYRVCLPPGGHEVAQAAVATPGDRLKRAEGATKATLFTVIPLAAVLIEAEGYIEVMMETERETVRAGRLMVRFAIPAAAAVAGNAAA